MRSTPRAAEMRRTAQVTVMTGCVMMVLASSPAQASTSAYHALQALDGQLHEAGWRLTTGNARYCVDQLPATGILLHDAGAYPDPPGARASLSLDGDIAIQAVAQGSPAMRAGLRPGMTVTAIDDIDPARARSQDEPPWQRLQAIRDTIDALLARDGAVRVTWRAPDAASGSVLLGSVAACRTRFEVAAVGTRALADGSRVVLGDRFPGFAYPADEFAAAVAHELAHNVLGHRAWLETNGRSRRNVRLTEREADRLAPWLLANAGYDPAAMARFMARWGPRHGGGLFRKRTHEGWDERVEAIEAELPLIASVRGPGGGADWSAHFRREIEP